MSAELKVTISAALIKGDLKVNFAPPQQSIDVSGQPVRGGVVSVGTSEEDLDVGDVATEGWLFLKNLDASNFITFGPKDTTMTAFGKLKAGESCCFRLLPGVTLRWQADTAAVNVQVELLSD
ncbi:MAG: hypothetical protein AB7O62_00395 [Pirellulales bacterium]